MKKIKLTNLNADSLSNNEMHNLNGGCSYSCACYFEREGGQSFHRDNIQHLQDPPKEDEV